MNYIDAAHLEARKRKDAGVLLAIEPETVEGEYASKGYWPEWVGLSQTRHKYANPFRYTTVMGTCSRMVLRKMIHFLQLIKL